MLNNNVSIISVSQLNTYIKGIIDDDFKLKSILVKGEISNLKYHPSGHIYFSLKDNESVIKCVIFSSSVGNLNFRLNDGDKIIVSGEVGVYTQGGTYQIYVKNAEKDGIGNLYLEYERLKKKLENEGVFSNYHKKTLKKYPFKIGVVTSSSGAALRDIISIVNRRWNVTSLVVFPCLVQGNEASKSIISALESAKNTDCDAIIIARGGGSIEDLWCFNSEELVYYLYDYPLVTVSAVGHETDFTLCDFVCDYRAPTPSAAAELVTPDKNAILEEISDYRNYITKQVSNIISNNRIIISNLALTFSKENLDNIINNYRNIIKNDLLTLSNCSMNIYKNNKVLIDQELTNLKLSFNNSLNNNKNEYSNLLIALDNMSPLKVLSRGYSVLKNNDKTVTSVDDVEINDTIEVNVRDGRFYASVNKKEEN